MSLDTERAVPSPRADWPGPAGKVSGNPLRLIENLRAEHGDFVRFSTNFGDTYLVNDPEGVREILYNPDSHPRTDILRPLLGEGLLQSEGDYWHSQRRLFQPRFHPGTLGDYLAIMVEEAHRMLNRWDAELGDGAEIVVSDEMMRLSLPVAARTMLGGQVEQDDESDLCRATNDILTFLGHLGSPITATITPGLARSMRESMDFMNRTVHRVLENRKRDGVRGNDLMSLLLQAVDPRDSEPLDDRQLRDEIVTVLLGGHETSGTMMTWMWYVIGQHPEVEKKLHEEWDRVLGDRDPTMDDLMRLEYTRMVMHETLRLYPPVWVLTRRVVADDVVRGWKIPKGAFSLVSAWMMHRHPELWDDPLAFKPERHTPEAVKARPRHAWFPFGVGPHLCIGQHFAQMEGAVMLPIIGRRWRIRPTAECEAMPIVTLRASGGVPARLEKRKP